MKHIKMANFEHRQERGEVRRAWRACNRILLEVKRVTRSSPGLLERTSGAFLALSEALYRTMQTQPAFPAIFEKVLFCGKTNAVSPRSGRRKMPEILTPYPLP